MNVILHPIFSELHETPTQSRRINNINESHEGTFLIYNGAPAIEDDPADYFRYTKGVRIA